MTGHVTEKDLFDPLREYFTDRGYDVQGEVRNCDLVARHGEELIAVEMKTGVTLQLVYQIVERQQITPSVYAAVPWFGKPPNKWRYFRNLMSRLGAGILVIHVLRSGTRIEPVLHPAEKRPVIQKRKKSAVIREFDERITRENRGGTVREPILTAYREKSLLVAYFLSLSMHNSPRELKLRGAPPETGLILYRNYYGWFQHDGPGRYSLHTAGRAALRRYEKVLKTLRKGHSDSTRGTE